MKKILLFSLLPFISNWIYAQPEPCLATNPDMTSLCVDACIICDIDGFTGRHDSDIPGILPDDFCTNRVHNGQWIAFIAGSENLVVDFAVSNCSLMNNSGLEIAIYEGIDCQNFRLVSNCFGAGSSIRPNTTGRVTVSEPLVIGQYYYLCMDGARGDNCDWTLSVVEGSTQVAPLETSGEIDGDFTSCPGVSNTYITSGEAGATIYEWTINGQPTGDNSQELIVDWTTEGSFQICVTAKNACDEAPPTCELVQVISIAPQTFNHVICEGESVEVNDTITLITEGNFEFNFLSEEGCDSTVFYNIVVNQPNTRDLAFNICEGDTVFVDGNPFFEAGQFTEVLQNRFGCDSTVNLDLGIIICEIEGNSLETPVICFGDSTGMIEFFVENGTPPFTYTWEILDESLSGNGSIADLNEPIVIQNLPKGTYLITINDNFGNDEIIIQDVTEPSLLTITGEASNFNGFNVSCFGGADGFATALPVGGVPPYRYAWSNGETQQTTENISFGDYSVNITDEYGCEIVLDISLNQPLPLEMNTQFQNPGCDGTDSGMIEIQSTRGGVPPYTYAFDNQPFSADQQSIQNLPEGTYTAFIQDANGCQTETTQTITAAIIPVIDLGEPITLFLGDSINLNIQSNTNLDSVLWANDPSLSCLNCPSPSIRTTVNSQYRVAVTSEDGCTTVDSVAVLVENRRRVFVPSAFSPNNDGINDFLQIFTGAEVVQIKTFDVFSRWGDHLFSQQNFEPNITNFGWDGTFRGQFLKPEIYAWFAEIEYLDGTSEIVEGDVTLVK